MDENGSVTNSILMRGELPKDEKSEIIHSSGYVKIESLHPDESNYNEKLNSQFFTAMSMGKWGS